MNQIKFNIIITSDFNLRNLYHMHRERQNKSNSFWGFICHVYWNV